MRHTPFVLAAVLATASAAPAAGQQQPPDPDRCRNTPEHRQLDFWIGTWDVIRPDDGQKLGENTIAPVEGLNGCALMENWTSARGFSGKSLNFYDVQRRTWRQVWVDGFGSALDYREGELRDGAMHFTGITIDAAGDTTLQKLVFTPVAADTVRQVFESSSDGGATWTTDWVGVYIRRPPTGSTGGGS